MPESLGYIQHKSRAFLQLVQAPSKLPSLTEVLLLTATRLSWLLGGPLELSCGLCSIALQGKGLTQAKRTTALLLPAH